MLYKERTEFQEFGHPKKDFRQCRDCKAVYYGKSWHHDGAFDLSRAKSADTLWLTRCPACKMVEDHQYEGKLTLYDIPKRFEDQLYHLIKAYCRRAYQKDCQHRLIALNKEGAQTWTATFTENQLANKLAQKIRQVFDKVEVKVAYSRAPDDVERIFINFLPALSFSG